MKSPYLFGQNWEKNVAVHPEIAAHLKDVGRDYKPTRILLNGLHYRANEVAWEANTSKK